jgi:HAD superfamily hydrolase (TIGR01509 family)
MYNLLFDFDGTLFDTESHHIKAFKATFSKYLGEVSFKYDEFKGMKTFDVFKFFTSDLEMVHNMSDFKSKFYIDSIYYINPLVNFDLLKEIALKNNLFIVTGARRISVVNILEYHNIYNLFSGIVSAEDYKNSKPHPECFLKCISSFNLSGAIYGIEDSLSGIESIKNANLTSIGVNNESIRGKSDYFYSDINGFLEYIIYKHQ